MLDRTYIIRCLFGELFHFVKDADTILRTSFATFTCDSIHPLFSHLNVRYKQNKAGNLFNGRIVAVSLASENEFPAPLLDLIKIVRGESDFIRVDAESLEIFELRVLELCTFLGGVCIVEADNEFAFIVSCCTGIEDGSFCMANVEVPARLPVRFRNKYREQRGRIWKRTSGGNRVTTLPISAPSSLNPIFFGLAFCAINTQHIRKRVPERSLSPSEMPRLDEYTVISP